MPNKDWEAGQNPSGADFDTYISQQVTALFDNAAGRDASTALEGMGSAADLVDGQRAYTRDDGRQWVWMVTDIPSAGDGYWVEVERNKAWGVYTPTVTVPAGGTDPTLGTGSVTFGRWTRHGSHATVALYVAFGTSMAAGSGIYEVSLPAACPVAVDWYTSQQVIVGNGISIDDNTGQRSNIALKTIAEDLVRIESDGLTGPVTESNLIVWSDNDVICSALIEYEMEMF